MDIRTLTHIADFNFNTTALGEIRCGPIGNELSKFDKMAREDVDNKKLARALVLAIAHKLTGDLDVDAFAGGPSVTEEEVALLLNSELDDFCDKFVSRRLRGGADLQQKEEGASPQEALPPGCAGLGPAIIAHTDSQRAQVDRILGEARKSILGATAFHSVGKAIQGNSIVESVKAFHIGETIAEQARKFRVGGVVEQMQRDVLKGSVLDAALRTVKASDNLGETIAALRATNATAHHFATPVESTTIEFEPPYIPPNPISETNDLLRKQQAYAEEMRPTIIRAAELIQTLTDTTLAAQALANDNSAQAERHARRSMWVAVVSIIIAVITGGFSIYSANLSPSAEQLERMAKEQIKQLNAVTASGQANHVVFEKKVNEDREKLTTVMAEQLELLKSMKTARGKSAQTTPAAQK